AGVGLQRWHRAPLARRDRRGASLLHRPRTVRPALPMKRTRKPLFAQNLLHGFALGELVDELVQIADFPHGFVLDFFHPNAADHACNQARVRLEARRLGIERLNVNFPVDCFLQAFRRMPGEPADYFVHFRLRPTFALGFLYVHRIDARKAHCVETRFGLCRLLGHCRLLPFVVHRRRKSAMRLRVCAASACRNVVRRHKRSGHYAARMSIICATLTKPTMTVVAGNIARRTQANQHRSDTPAYVRITAYGTEDTSTSTRPASSRGKRESTFDSSSSTSRM